MDGAPVQVEDAISSFEKELDVISFSNRARSSRHISPAVNSPSLLISMTSRWAAISTVARVTPWQAHAAQVPSRLYETRPRKWRRRGRGGGGGICASLRRQ